MWLTYSSDITQQDFTIIALCERKTQFNNLLQNDIVPHYTCKIESTYLRPFLQSGHRYSIKIACTCITILITAQE